MMVNSEVSIYDQYRPSSKEMNLFLKKFELFSKLELLNVLKVTNEDFRVSVNREVACIGCRRSVETAYKSEAGCRSGILYPFLIDPQGTIVLNKEGVQASRLHRIISSTTNANESLVGLKKKCLSGRRCWFHALKSGKDFTVNDLMEILKGMTETDQKRVLNVDGTRLMKTLVVYLTEKKMSKDDRSKVFSEFRTLIGEIDASMDYESQLYKGIRCCNNRDYSHLHIRKNTEVVSRLITKAMPYSPGSRRRECSKKTAEMAPHEIILKCIGICITEEFHCVYKETLEKERAWEIISYITSKALRLIFELAVEKKRGISQLEILCEEVDKEEKVKQRKRRKKENRKSKKDKKAEGCQKSCEIVEDLKPDHNGVEYANEQENHPCERKCKSVPFKSSYLFPYRTLEEQLQSSKGSDEEDFIPEEEVRAMLTPRLKSLRDMERVNIRRQFSDKFFDMSKFESTAGDCRSVRRTFASVEREDSCEIDQVYGSCSGDATDEKQISAHKKKSHKRRQGGEKFNKNYKGKNRR